MRSIHRRLSRAHFRHTSEFCVHLVGWARKGELLALPFISHLLLHHSLIQHLVSQRPLTQYPLSISERKLPLPVQIRQPALPCISRYSLKTSPFNLAYNSWWTVAWKKRDPEVLLSFSKCLRKELGWKTHIKDITLETSMQRDLVIDISLGILAYWKGGLRVNQDEIWTWMLFNLDAFRNSLGLSWQYFLGRFLFLMLQQHSCSGILPLSPTLAKTIQTD